MSRTIFPAIFLFFCTTAFAEPVVVERDSALFSEPRADAHVNANVKQGTSGNSYSKRGAWIAVKTSAGSGWMPSFNLRYVGTGAAAATADTSFLDQLMNRATITPTIGVRGLDKEDLKDAQFNARQMTLLEQNRASEAQARAAASAAGLRAQKLDMTP